jgi:hypothetical protein
MKTKDQILLEKCYLQIKENTSNHDFYFARFAKDEPNAKFQTGPHKLDTLMRDWGDEMMSRSTGGFNKIINLSFNDLILTASNGDFAVLTKDDSKIQYKGNLYYKMALQNSDRVNIMIPSMDAYRAFKAWATGDQQALSDILNNKDQEIKENDKY